MEPHAWTAAGGSFCGCCGIECGGEWCDRCETHILKTPGLPPWKRTYFAQQRTNCPFEQEDEVSVTELPE